MMRKVMLAVAAIAISTPAEARRVKASWYSQGTHVACRLNGSNRFHPDAMTAAHRRLPCGSKVRITYRGRSVTVTINDRGPFIRGREIDLSRGAARAIGLTHAGVAVVDLEVLNKR